MDFFGFTLVEVHSASEISRVFFCWFFFFLPNLVNIQPLFLLAIFQHHLSFSPSSLRVINVRSSAKDLWVSVPFFQSIFSLLFKLGNFYCPVSKFTNSSLCLWAHWLPCHSVTEPSIEFFISVSISFTSQISTWVSCIYFFAKAFYFFA